MTIEEKYKIHYINNRRYYEFDVLDPLPILEDTIPFLFRYKDIEIYENSWKRMTVAILEELDKNNPKSEEALLSIKYTWSRQNVFSREKRTNFSDFKNIYLNTNHTATHAMMNIQGLLKEYGINGKECFFLIRRHPISEPEEAREYFREKIKNEFIRSCEFKGFSNERIEVIQKNVAFVNSILKSFSPGFDDFYLFDNYPYFCNYRDKVIEMAEKKYFYQEKVIRIVKKALSYLEDFFRNRAFYSKVFETPVSKDFISTLGNEIDFLFSKLQTRVILARKLFARMSLLYPGEMTSLGSLNNPNDLFNIASCFFSSKYFYKYPFISIDEDFDFTKEDLLYSYAYSLDEITISKMNDYIETMHLKRPNNYIQFFEECSDEYVQVESEKLIRKSVLDLPSEMIESVDKSISFYINSFGKIDSEMFLGYSSLPKFSFPWNRWFFIGTVRSFLKEKYEIIYQNNDYRKLSFQIIKKVSEKGI